MVQVLPYVPSFGEKLADTLSNAAGNVAEGYALRRQNQNDQTQYGILNDPNSSPIQKAIAATKLSEGKKKHSGMILSSVLGEQAKTQEAKNQLNQFYGQSQGQAPAPNQLPQAINEQSQSPVQGLINAVTPQQNQQLPNANLQKNAQLLQNPSTNQNAVVQNTPIGGPLSNKSDEELRMAAAIPGAIGESAKQELNHRKDVSKQKLASTEFERKKFEADRDYHTKLSAPILKEAEDLRRSLPERENAIDRLTQAFEDPDLGGVSGDYLADLFHFEPLRTAKGGEVKSALKSLLVGTIRALPGRPNQWIEQQVNGAFAQFGRKPWANGAANKFMKWQVEYDRHYLDSLDQVAAKDMENFGYVKSDVASRAVKEMEPWINKSKNMLSYDLRKNYENSLTDIQLKDQIGTKVPAGTALTVRMRNELLDRTHGDKEKAFQIAKKMGFSFINPETGEKE